MNKTFFALASASALALVSCSLGNADSHVSTTTAPPPVIDPGGPVLTDPENPNNPADPNNPNPTDPAQCDVGKSYVGFAGTQLEVGRVDEALGGDVARVKPFSALTAEYPRVLGTSPTLLTGMNATFGDAPPRWYVEPQASAISLYTSYRIAFQGCLTYTASPSRFSATPAADIAATECAAFARTFWNRDASSAELDACVQVAVVDTTKETDPRRRWAYTCAAVLNSAGFLTY